MNIKELESVTDNWYDQVVDIVDGEHELGTKYAVWRLKLTRAKADFKKILEKSMTFMRRRLTRDPSEIKDNFIEMVKIISSNVSVEVKESDKSLEHYREHE